LPVVVDDCATGSTHPFSAHLHLEGASKPLSPEQSNFLLAAA
jgi:hypothetical protein